MTIVDVGPRPLYLFPPGPPPRILLHQRLSGPAWRRVTTLATVAVVVLFTVLAVVVALRAPVISPVTAPVAGVPAAPAPTSGLLDLFGSFGVGPDGPARGGGGRGR